MKFWLLLNGKPSGPVEASRLVSMEGYNPGMLLCPVNKSKKKLSNWQPAFRFKEVREFDDSLRERQEAEASGDGPQAPRLVRPRPARWLERLAYAMAGGAVLGAGGLLFLLPASVPGGGAVAARGAPRLLFPTENPGQPAGELELARLKGLLAPIRIGAGKGTLGEAAGPQASWRAWPLDRARVIIELRRAPRASPSRFLFDVFSGTLRPANPEARALIGDKPLAVR